MRMVRLNWGDFDFWEVVATISLVSHDVGMGTYNTLGSRFYGAIEDLIPSLECHKSGRCLFNYIQDARRSNVIMQV